MDAPTIDKLRGEIADLRASCARVLNAADEQRRSIERELHDGAMQNLVALGVRVQLASRLIENDAPAAVKLLDEMMQDVHDALDDLRRLAWRVYPSLLLDRGLGDALEAAASLFGISTRVEVAGVGRPAPEIEASVYFCCVELLQYAAEDGGRALVRVQSEADVVRFVVTLENGNVERWRTRDLRSVTDRLGAFGGRLVVEAVQGVSISGVLQGAVVEPCSSAR